MKRRLLRIVTVIIPWPSRSERKARVERAAAERERSRIAAGVAAAIKQDIRRMAAEDHFADTIIRQIREGG